VIKTLQVDRGRPGGDSRARCAAGYFRSGCAHCGFIVESGTRAGRRGQQMGWARCLRPRQIKGDLESAKLKFLDFANFHYVSALKGQGLKRMCSGRSMRLTRRPRSICRRRKLTRALIDAVAKAGAATQWNLPAEAALRPPGRAQSTVDRDPRQCPGQDPGFLSALPRAHLPRSVQAAGNASANPVQRLHQPFCRQTSARAEPAQAEAGGEASAGQRSPQAGSDCQGKGESASPAEMRNCRESLR
jgi:hypothetical protein